MSHTEPAEPRKRKGPEAKRTVVRRPRHETHSTKAPTPAIAHPPSPTPTDGVVSAGLGLSERERERIRASRAEGTTDDAPRVSDRARGDPPPSTSTPPSDPVEEPSVAPDSDAVVSPVLADPATATGRPERPERGQINDAATTPKSKTPERTVDRDDDVGIPVRPKGKSAWEEGFAAPGSRARTLGVLASDTSTVLWGPERRRWVAEASLEAHRAPSTIAFSDCVVCGAGGRAKDGSPATRAGLVARTDGCAAPGCSRDAAWDNLLGGKYFGAPCFDPLRPGPGLEALVREGMDPYRARAMALGVYTIAVAVQARELGLLGGSLLERLASRVGGCLIEVGGSGSRARTSMACLFAGGTWRTFGTVMVDTPMSLRVRGAPRDASFAAHASPSLAGAMRYWASELHGHRDALDLVTHLIRVPLFDAGSLDPRESRAVSDLMRLSTARREAAVGLPELETYLSDCEVLRRVEGEDFAPDVPLGAMSVGVVPLLAYHARDEGLNARKSSLEADLVRRSGEAPSLSERLACVRCLGALRLARASRASEWSLFVLCTRLHDLVRGLVDLEDPHRVPEGLRPPFRPERDFSTAHVSSEELKALAEDAAKKTETLARAVVERFEHGVGEDTGESLPDPRAKRGTLDPRNPKPVGLRETVDLDAAVSFRANRKRVPGDKTLDVSADPRFVASA